MSGQEETAWSASSKDSKKLPKSSEKLASEPSNQPDPDPIVQAEDLPVNQENLPYRESTIPPWRFAFLCVGLCLGLFMAMMDASIVATSLYTIGVEFNDLEHINWVALAYSLAFLGCSVFFASMSDVIGRRNAFVVAFVLFFAFSLGCGFAHNMATLIACRTFQGIGGAGLFSVTMITFPELTPKKLKGVIAPLLGMIISFGGILGPVLGGVFTKYASWRWVFWLNGPLGFVSMLLFYAAWPKAEHLPTLQQRSWRDLDFLGSFLVVAAAVLVTFAFQSAGTDVEANNPWISGLFIGPLVTGSICWVGLFLWQHVFERTWPRKMAAIPLGLFRNHIFAAAALHTVFLGFAYLAALYAIPLRLQVVNSKSPIMAGVMMLPMLGATGVGSVLTGILSSKTNRLFETMTFGAVLVTLGLALESTVSDSQVLEQKFLGFLVLLGLGIGMINSAATIFTTIEAPIPEHAPAQGIIAQSRMLGGSIGIAMSSAVLAGQQRAHLAGVVSLSDLQDLKEAEQRLTPAQLTAIRTAYNNAFTETMKVCAIVTGIGVLIALGTYRHGRVPLGDQRAQQVKAEIERRRAERELDVQGHRATRVVV
ncbi:major facilitator superfamily transporter [Coniella lustricola]|uniref:Major facilitator superfamily transporter n=1 Tax=Coniella lustricola TaxID=2025994 RepID=A0A2T3AKP4_9PEZI|nr:major facilitator superfamily transporter [Coniella lustricola]